MASCSVARPVTTWKIVSCCSHEVVDVMFGSGARTSRGSLVDARLWSKQWPARACNEAHDEVNGDDSTCIVVATAQEWQ